MVERSPLFQKRSLGQVFLKTDWPVIRMVDRLVSLGVKRVLEIGPGNGILTRALVERGILVTAVEKDERFAERMREYSSTLSDGRMLTVHNADILRFDWQSWLDAGSGKAAVVGNIPYNISTPILMRGLLHLHELSCLLFMTQLEFAARAVGRANTKDYGSLSVFTQLRAEASIEFNVPRTLFHPVPKVDSAVMLLLPKREPLAQALLVKAETVTRVAFTQRRKKLRNSIRVFLESVGEQGCPIDLERRADSVQPQEFVKLAQFLLHDADE